MKKSMIIGLLLGVAGCSGVQLTVEQYKCVSEAEEEAHAAAFAFCEHSWDDCEHAASIRNDFREDVNACLGVK